MDLNKIQKARFIPMKSDYGFKKTFANESNTLFLRTAIQALIQSPYVIEKVELSRNEFPGLTLDSRGGIYDLICTDEHQNVFIVEIQLTYYKHFVQRSKFYAFHKFNTQIQKGDFKYQNLTKIYAIGFLAKNIFPYKNYYHFSQLKNQKGQIIDDQMFHIIVEMDKFTKQESEIQTTLDKLIYTVKNIGEITEPIKFPKFWTEEWIQVAIKELDKGIYSSEERSVIEMALAKEASIVEMIEEEREERKKLEREKFIIEHEKTKAEQEKAKAEQEKAKAEQEKAKAEQEKVKAKQEKVKAEQEKDKAEQEKDKAEQEKVKAEQEKVKAEQEKDKTEQEKIRVEQEKDKTEQEKIRVEQEKDKIVQEKDKIVQAKLDQERIAIERMIQLNLLPLEQIAEIQGVDLERVLQIQKKLNQEKS